MKLNINSKAVVAHTNRLKKLHRSALPNAIRNTLNEAALDVKKNTMPTLAKNKFTQRQPNFFKANSKVDFAKGYNINSMKATVGFIEQSLKGSNNYAVKDLEQQEEGGSIQKKSFIPLKQARQGNSNNKLVRSNARLSSIKKITNVKNSNVRNKKQAFVKSAIEAGVGGFLLSGKTLWKINGFKRNGKINKTAMYNFKKGRNIHVRPTNFMKKASIESAEKMETMFIKQANKQIERLK